MSSVSVSAEGKNTSIVTLWNILHRLFRWTLPMKNPDFVPHQPPVLPVTKLTLPEQNAMRYMASYTAFKLLKKY